ncbi:MAG: arylamine N-acetyltransferase [Actinomycetota bacterium]|nr:arylamine N-acetyltransferase [Actinomycetota bacterium]
MFAVEPYLARLGVPDVAGPPTYELLARLQLAHLMHVPFENLHAFHRRGIRTDLAWSYPKVVQQRRGGWCFELNGCFGELLRRLGFQVDLVSCQVWEFEQLRWGPQHDHLALVVHLDGERWLVDVGFGDCSVQPLLIVDGEREATPRRARIELHDDAAGFELTELVPLESGAIEWEPQLRVSFAPQQLPVFDGRNTFLQTEPGLSWTEKAFATRALGVDGSRITLRMNVLRRRIGIDQYDSEPIETAEQWSAALLEHFGMVDTNTH